MGVSRVGVLLLALIVMSATGCQQASQPSEIDAIREYSAEPTSVPRYQIPRIELRGAKRPRLAARLQNGHVIFPRGDVTAAAASMAGGPLEVPLGDTKALIDMIESTSMKPGYVDISSELDAYLYLDVDVGGGQQSVIDLRFGLGDAVLLTNYGYGGGASYIDNGDCYRLSSATRWRTDRHV